MSTSRVDMGSEPNNLIVASIDFLRDLSYFSTALGSENEAKVRVCADLIAALSRELEELRTPVTAENYGPTLAAKIKALPEHLFRYVMDLETRADPAGDVRRAYVAEEKAMALNKRVEELESELAALRRPVVQSEQVEAIRDRDSTMTAEDIRASKSSQLYADRRYLLYALDQAQRKKAMVGEALAWTIKNRAYVFEGQVYCLEPCATGHEHLLPILLQYAGSKQA